MCFSVGHELEMIDHHNNNNAPMIQLQVDSGEIKIVQQEEIKSMNHAIVVVVLHNLREMSIDRMTIVVGVHVKKHV